jgi:membrane protein DedA with SNARE-associated domain
MSERILAFLVQFITHVIDAGGYAGIVALLAINSACIPLPSELIMPFSGYLVYLGRFNLILVALAGAVGATWVRRLLTGWAPRADGRWWSATGNGC